MSENKMDLLKKAQDFLQAPTLSEKDEEKLRVCEVVELFDKAAHGTDRKSDENYMIMSIPLQAMVEGIKENNTAMIALAENSIGTLYARGRAGFPQNEAKALFWYKRSADKGCTDGMYNLAIWYALGNGGLNKNEAKAFELFSKAAEKGNVNAMFNIGTFYYDGTFGVSKDVSKAKEWWKKAAAEGHENAKYNLKQLR